MNLDSTIDFDLKKFFQWWSSELAFLVPESLRKRLRERQGFVIFSPASQGFLVSLLDDEQNLQLQQRIDLNQPESFQQLIQQNPTFEKAEWVLRLPAEQALQKLIYLPAAAQENLQQVVGFELDRYTPFKPEQVYFAALPLGNTDYAQIRLLLIVVPRTSLDEQLSYLAALGVQPQRVDYASTLTDFPQTLNTYNLLPERFRQHASKLSQSLHWLVTTLVMLLMMALLVWPVWQEGQAVDALKTRIKLLEKQNRIVDAQQNEIDAVHAETKKLIDIKQQSPALIAVLNELSRLLNDETWLTHLHFSDVSMQIQGQSPAASALISTLEGSEFFSNVSFVSPLTQDKTTGRERFQISMTITMPLIENNLDQTKASDEEKDPDDSPTADQDVPEDDSVEGIEEQNIPENDSVDGAEEDNADE